jgi:succinate-semialdehyde dehydrogenase/glutarate-semialdehyde dehydrogenase
MDGCHYIAGKWTNGTGDRVLKVVNPATGETVRDLLAASSADIDAALAAGARGFQEWRRVNPLERSAILRKAAELQRARAEPIAQAITREQGKTIAEARVEASRSAEHIEWNAEEGRRAYGRVIPSRIDGVHQFTRLEPVGCVAAFSPWNFPVGQLVRKIASALAAGCSIIVKAPEETPTGPIELVRCFADAGVPAGAINLVFGDPPAISRQLLASSAIKKVTFTGSVAVGRLLNEMAARSFKHTTMELGGHAPFIVCDDTDIDLAVRLGLQHKFRNAGQVCASPTRFLVQDSVYAQFLEAFAAGAAAIKVGDGTLATSQMGALAQPRRVEFVDALIRDAVAQGARLVGGGTRIGNAGCFYAPTVLADVPVTARIMNEEPFGPVAIINRFAKLDDAIAEANRLDFGLTSYGFTRSLAAAQRLGQEIEAGMVSLNHLGLGAAETPFGGVKDSGIGSEGGVEGLQPYFTTKFVTQIAA